MIEKVYPTAYAFAAKAHEGQFRKDGVTPYITHPVAVAERILEEKWPDPLHRVPVLLEAALLHDVVEDTPVTIKEVEEAFGKEVARVVGFLTNDPQLKGNRRFRKFYTSYLLGFAPDDVKIVKLVDRIHNLETFPEQDVLHFGPLYAIESMELANAFKAAPFGYDSVRTYPRNLALLYGILQNRAFNLLSKQWTDGV